MFKMSSFEAEIAKSMANNLASTIETKKQEIEKTAQLAQSEKVSQAIDHLNAAAELFDTTGFVATAEAITCLIEKLANNTLEIGEQIIDITPITDKKKV